jgi:bifunctional DNA-binding transcriptional regulator/antitoxin component of YhaV-PrlF toxin-antitoxin module
MLRSRVQGRVAVSLSEQYPLLMADKVKQRRNGFTRLSSKNQATIPVRVLAEAGLEPGDELRVEAAGPGRVTLVRVEDPLKKFAGALTGVYGPGYLEKLRAEWD